VQAAIAGIVTGFAGVLAVLQSNFARTVALGAALAADLEKRVCLFSLHLHFMHRVARVEFYYNISHAAILV
jgi:hypothetical protein